MTAPCLGLALALALGVAAPEPGPARPAAAVPARGTALPAAAAAAPGLEAGLAVPGVAPSPAPFLREAGIQGPVRVADDLGTTVELAAPPRRIVSVAPSNTELLFAMGLGDRVVGVSDHADYPPAALELPTVGAYAGIDVERVLALEPDVVLASGFQSGSAVPALRGLGVPVYVVEPRGVAGLVAGIRRLGVLTAAPRAAASLAGRLEERIEAVRRAVAGAPRRRVFYELSAELFTVGPGSYIHDMIELAGGENVAGDADRPYPQISPEVVVARDPEVVFLADHEAGVDAASLARRPGWEGITAVVEGRVVPVDDADILNRPGPRLVEGLEIIARGIHPERFR